MATNISATKIHSEIGVMFINLLFINSKCHSTYMFLWFPNLSTLYTPRSNTLHFTLQLHPPHLKHFLFTLKTVDTTPVPVPDAGPQPPWCRRRTRQENARLMQGLKTWNGRKVHRMPMVKRAHQSYAKSEPRTVQQWVDDWGKVLTGNLSDFPMKYKGMFL